MMTLSNTGAGRRQFLRSALGVAAAAPALSALDLLSKNGRAFAAPGAGGYGPLIPVADERDGVFRLALPEGFTYRSFSVSGEMMDDGKLVPIAMDGMGAFTDSDGKIRLVRNHEDRNSPNNGTIDALSYDLAAGGGTTTLVVNPANRKLERHFVSITGTIVNCAGGITPWGSWITCEETNAGTPSGWGAQHGYCFEVPAEANGPVAAVPITQMGRFAHEAIAVDPATGYVYETEDNGNNSGFYKYVPNSYGDMLGGGTLWMLRHAIVNQYNTYTAHTPGEPIPVTWVPIANPNPPGTSSTAVFSQGRTLGGMAFGRLEGAWYAGGAIYFVSTSGGAVGEGQVWEFRPTSNEDGILTLIYESLDAAVLNAPDNLCVSPQGALLLCEDGDGDQFLRGVTLGGLLFDFAKNLETTHEWAGACFHAEKVNGARRGDPYGHATLFVNRQGSTSGPTPPANPMNNGMTFAIWGPWSRGAL